MERHGIDLAGRDVCVVGRGVTVGRSIGLLLGRKDVNATVDICHTGTTDLAEHVRRADVVISAAGSPGIITPEMVAPGAIVLDVGVSRVVDPPPARAASPVTSPTASTRWPPGSRPTPAEWGP